METNNQHLMFHLIFVTSRTYNFGKYTGVKVLTNMMYVCQRRDGCKQSASDVSLMRREQRNGSKSIQIISNDDDDNDGDDGNDDDYDDFQQ